MDRAVLDSFLSQGEEYQILFHQLENRSAVHAYLITGEKGVGKRTLAGLMAAALLCSSGNGRPCGVCKNCLLAEKREHPDLILIEKGNPIAQGVKKDRATIPVEDIREMIRLCGVRSTEGNMHVVLLFDADKMTPQAQNCLLKTLEEPPADTCLILVTDHPESLLTTVISRCRQIRMKAWSDEYILRVLRGKGVPSKRAEDAAAASGGSVGRALELVSDDRYWELREEVMNCFFRTTARSDILKISNAWKDRKQEAEQMTGILEAFVGMLSEARYGRSQDLSAFPPQWQRFAREAPPDRFLALSECIVNARKQLQFSVNFQAVLEKMIFTFMGEGNAWLQ